MGYDRVAESQRGERIEEGNCDFIHTHTRTYIYIYRERERERERENNNKKLVVDVTVI